MCKRKRVRGSEGLRFEVGQSVPSPSTTWSRIFAEPPDAQLPPSSVLGIRQVEVVQGFSPQLPQVELKNEECSTLSFRLVFLKYDDLGAGSRLFRRSTRRWISSAQGFRRPSVAGSSRQGWFEVDGWRESKRLGGAEHSRDLSVPRQSHTSVIRMLAGGRSETIAEINRSVPWLTACVQLNPMRTVFPEAQSDAWTRAEGRWKKPSRWSSFEPMRRRQLVTGSASERHRQVSCTLHGRAGSHRASL